jgi:hypothetical protein
MGFLEEDMGDVSDRRWHKLALSTVGFRNRTSPKEQNNYIK